MARTDLGSLWDAWRTRSDEDALFQLLDAVEPELLRAARRYSRDESSAHDLVQETWQAALSKAHAYDPSQPLVPWLIGFLLVESKRERRRSSRGVDPDRLHAREEPPPDHAASHDEQRRMVKSAVASLPDLYREVVELTYERGLEPAQIAEKLKRAPGTVRVQLHRGLAKLREALPAGLSLGVAVMLLGGTSEAALRAMLADAALSQADEIARAAPAAASTAVSWKITAAIVALVGVAGTVVWWARSEATSRTSSAPDLARNVESDSRSHPTHELNAVGTAGKRDSVTPVSTTTTPIEHAGVFVVGSVSGFTPDAKVANEHFAVTLRPVDTRLEALQAEVPAGARFEVDVSAWYAADAARPREFFCIVDSPRYMPAHANVWVDDAHLAAALGSGALVSDAHKDHVEIQTAIDLAPALCIVTGRAVLPTAAPRAGTDLLAYAALLEMQASGAPAMEPTEAVAASSDGTFRLRSLHAGHHVLAVVSDRARPFTLPLDLQAGVVQDVGTVVCESGSSVAGTVRRADGSPVPGVRVSAQLQGAERARSVHGHPLVWMHDRFEHPGRNAPTDDHGLFFVDGLAPLEYAVTDLGTGDAPVLPLDDRLASVDTSSAPDKIVVHAPASGLELHRIGTSAFLHVTSAGEPVPSCAVHRLLGSAAADGISTNDAGLVELRAALPLTARLRLEKLGYLPAEVTITPANLAARERVEVVLERGPAPSFVTFDLVGAKLESAYVTLAPLQSMDAASIDAARAGRLRLKDLMVDGTVTSSLDASGRMRTAIGPGRYTGEIHDTSMDGLAPAFRSTWFDIDVPPGVEYRFRVEIDAGGRFRVPPPQYAGKAARLTVEVADEQAKTIPVTFSSSVLRSDARQGRTGGTGLLVGASSVSSALPPGTYTVRVSAPDAQTFEGRVVIEAGKTVELPVALEPR